MDNIAVRARYPRYSVPARRRKKPVKENSAYKERLSKQILVCILILLFSAIIKNADTSATIYISEKVQGILSYDLDVKGVYDSIEAFIGKTVKKDTSKAVKSEDGFNEDALPVNASIIDVQNIKKDNEASGANKAGGGSSQLAPITTSSPKPSSTPLKSPSPTTTPPTSTMLQLKVGSPFALPVNGMLGEPFGERVHPLTNKLVQHKGIDIEANQGIDVKVVADGEVLDAAYEKTLGYFIKIQHENGLNTIYAHCSKLVVKKGQKVKQGDIISKVGNTGLSTGAHLHFEVWKDGKVVNPLEYLAVN